MKHGQKGGIAFKLVATCNGDLISGKLNDHLKKPVCNSSPNDVHIAFSIHALKKKLDSTLQNKVRLGLVILWDSFNELNRRALFFWVTICIRGPGLGS